MSMMLKGCLIASQPVLPGIWQRKDGGYLVRARAKDGTIGRLKEIFKVMPDADPASALKWLHDERARVREGVDSAPTPKMRFSEFAAQQLEHKVKVRDIKSAKGRKKWGGALEHLVKGTNGKTSGVFVRGFGDFYMHKIHTSHVEMWKEEMPLLIAAGDYAPTTVNGWLAILKVIMKAGKRRLSLPTLATEGVESFDLSEHDTYTDEQPNSLTPDEVPSFLEKFKELHPAHYGMVFLGLVTGLRPSSLRPPRREGPASDVDWDKGCLRVRRSHTVGEEIMKTTKQKRRYVITLPPEAMAVLRWHVETQLTTPEQQESELLFPAVNGKYRSPSVLNKPLDEVGLELGLKKTITQRALRRTFNDLARAAQVNDLVTRSISGHQTEQMQHHYSTVNGGEQRDALAKVISLFGASGGQSGGQSPPAGGQKSEKAG